MDRKNTKVSRWLSHIGACSEAQHYFAHIRTFDTAWKQLDNLIWIWWIGYSMGAPATLFPNVRYLCSDREVDLLKKRLYRRVKRAYEDFNG